MQSFFGGQAVIVDTKRETWLDGKETLPEIADEINILNLTSRPENQGVLDPYVHHEENRKGLIKSLRLISTDFF